eukprot:10238950-Alexandrium_andersonii.AAC.1
MSASLVGSEMCIRDSESVPAHARACERQCAPMLASAHESIRVCRTPCESCLLYTSDAADDM